MRKDYRIIKICHPGLDPGSPPHRRRLRIKSAMTDFLVSPLNELIKFELDASSIHAAKSLHFFRVNDVKVDIIDYPYAWLEPPIETDGVRMAGLKDIAAMKLSAITNRGRKKDFIDIYFLLQHFSLETMLNLYEQKYAHGSSFNVLRSLSYFEDAEDEPMPKMFYPVSWDEIKSTIRLAIEQY